MADTKEYKPQTVEYNNGSPSTSAVAEKKPGKMKAHFKKFWWLHLISFCFTTLLLSLLLTYVGLPRIAQGDVNKAEMIINEQIITEPTPNQVNIHVVSTVKSGSIFTPTLDGFEASLFLEDTEPNIIPFGKLNIPSVHATKVSQADVSQVLPILDKEQFKRYNRLVHESKSFRLGLRGRTKLHLGALPVVTVDFNKAIELKGLNGLAGIEVKDIKISLTPLADGSNMNGTIIIPNPSIMTITLGTVVQDIFSAGKPIGNTTIENVVLKPGNNEFPMKSTAEQGAVLELINKSGILPVEAKVRTITFKGQRLEYFEYAMANTPVKLNLDLKDALKGLGLDPSLLGGGSAH